MDYLYIRKWGRIVGSHDYYIENQVAKARRDNAPQNAIYKEDDGWKTIEDITNSETRRELGLLGKVK
jgi:hypothetical protein